MPINTDPHIHQNVMCANVYIRKGDKYLLLKRSPKKRFLPNLINPIGGKIEPNENPYQAALREVQEEAGITLKNLRLEAVILEIQPYKDKPHNWLVFHFSADWDAGELQPTEEGEFMWFTAAEIPQQPLFPSVREIIHHILNPKDGTVFATISYDEKGKVVNVEKQLCL
ncbi:MAG: NUDIX domain-containing protein [Patescibacteria group bacterium]|jgi:8-oxo-dGTP diphosphatase